MKVRDTDKTAEIGKAWANEDGSMSIQLNPGVSIRWDDPFLITAFPIDKTD